MVISYILNKGATLVGKKWRAVVIWHLSNGPLRFSELKRRIPEVSVKVLSEVLQDMEQNDLIIRTQYNVIPVKVTYQLHPESTEFVEANLKYTIETAKYLVKNKHKVKISKDMTEAIDAFLAEYRKQATK